MADVGKRGDRPSDREAPALIELVMLDPAPAPSIGAPSATPRPRAPRPRRRWPPVALAAVLAVVIVATVLGDAGDDGQPAAVPVSTLTPTSIAATSIPATSVAPTTAPATTAGSPVTSARVSLGPGPVLGVERGWTLVSFDSPTLQMLDLDTGKSERFEFDIRRFAGATESVIVFSDRFVYTQHDGAPAVWSQRFVDKAPTILINDASIIAASSDAGRFWVALNQAGVNGEQLVAEVDTSGRRHNIVAVPLGLQVTGASAAGLWLRGSGRIYHFTSGGALQAVAIGTTIDASRTGVLYDDCAIAGPCTLRVASTPGSQPSSSNIGPSALIETARPKFPSDPAMSPNGRWLLLYHGVLDRRTSDQTFSSFLVEAWRWSPDGEWLFARTSFGAIAWNLADGRQIPLGDLALAGIVAVTR